MYLAHLKLKNFRCFKDLELSPPPGITIFVGGNAQGKTTLLEAIYLLAIAKAFRAENEREVVNWQEVMNVGQAFVDGVISNSGESTRVIVGYQVVGDPQTDRTELKPHNLRYAVRKEIRVGGVRRTASGLVGLLNVVLFSANDIDLIQGSPATRRRYLDILISQADSLYLKALQRYRRVLHQRNQLLRLIHAKRAGGDELEFWNRELAREGAFIIQRRCQVMGTISVTGRQILLELTGDREELDLIYGSNVQLDEGIQIAEEAFLVALESSRQKDFLLGSTSVGPHRDDFKILVNGRNMDTFSSRGQARTLGLTLRLAEAAYLKAFKGEPIVLLDDVLSELDFERRHLVLERVRSYDQIFLTATEIGPFQKNFLSESALCEINAGSAKWI